MILFLLCLTAIIVSCNNAPNVITYDDPVTHEIFIDTLPYGDMRDFPKIAIEKNVDTLILGMSKGNIVCSRCVGIACYYSKEFACFERLCQILNEKEIYQLTMHNNPVVRLYGYIALDKSNSHYLENARSRLKKDTAHVKTFEGCLMMTYSIKDFMKL